MDQREKDIITAHTETIVNLLKVDHVIDYLYQEKLIPEGDYEDLIESEARNATERKNRTKRLLIFLKKSENKNSFVLFCEALRRAGHVDLLELIRPTPSPNNNRYTAVNS